MINIEDLWLIEKDSWMIGVYWRVIFDVYSSYYL
jgi:hypothetical protein